MSTQRALIAKLSAEFRPHFLTVENESHLHASGHGGNSHFNIVIVSDEFEGIRQVARHQRIYRLLAEELRNGIHALALHTYTADEWRQAGEVRPESIGCHGVGR